jgi:hypothetical protein
LPLSSNVKAVAGFFLSWIELLEMYFACVLVVVVACALLVSCNLQSAFLRWRASCFDEEVGLPLLLLF